VRVQFVTEQLSFSGEHLPMADLLLSVLGRVRPVRTGVDPGTSTGGDRPGQGPRRVPRPQAIVDPRARSRVFASASRPESRRPAWPGSWVSAARPSTSTCVRRS
jgi:hypothetical protein